MTTETLYQVPKIPRDFRITKKMLRAFSSEDGKKQMSYKRLKYDMFPDHFLKALKLSDDSYKKIRKFGKEATRKIIEFNQFDEEDLQELIDLQ